MSKVLPVACAAVWIAAITVNMAAYKKSRTAVQASQPALSAKEDRPAIRVIPLSREPALTQEALVRYAKPVVALPAPTSEQPAAATTPTPAPIEPAIEQQRHQATNICDRTGGWKITTRNGKSWRCAYGHRS